MLVAKVDFPTPPLGLATRTTGMRGSLLACEWTTKCYMRRQVPPRQYVSTPVRRPAGCAMFAAMPSSTDIDAAPRIYLLAAHPHWRDSRINRRLLAAAREVP